MGDLTNSTPAVLMKDFVIRYLGDVAPGSLDNWGWTLGKQPNAPDQLITFIDQGAQASFSHLLVDYVGLQLLVRGTRGGDGYNTSWLMARLIRDAILGMDGHPAEFPELDGVSERGTIVPIGYDVEDRHSWSCNFQLIIEPGVSAITHRASL